MWAQSMAKMTNPARPINPDLVSRPAFVLTESYPPTTVPWHAHRRAQLIHASTGVLTVRTSAGLWVVPPERAVWIPAGIDHQVSSQRSFRLRTLYIDADLLLVPTTCGVVHLDRLAQELLAAVALIDPLERPTPAADRLIHVLLDRLSDLAVAPLHLPSPRDPLLRRIADALAARLAEPQSLTALAAEVGLHARTVARHFRAETGMTVGRWRQQLRLLTALEALGAGASVTRVAFDVGYADVSSFIAAFKSATGSTPALYFRAAGSVAPSRRSKR